MSSSWARVMSWVVWWKRVSFVLRFAMGLGGIGGSVAGEMGKCERYLELVPRTASATPLRTRLLLLDCWLAFVSLLLLLAAVIVLVFVSCCGERLSRCSISPFVGADLQPGVRTWVMVKKAQFVFLEKLPGMCQL